MEQGTCAIWGTPADTVRDEGANVTRCDSPRAGGQYKISDYALMQKKKYGAELAAKYTTWLVEQRLQGIKCPEIISEQIVETIIKRPLLRTSERLRKFFLYCSIYKNRIGNRVFWRAYASKTGSNVLLHKEEAFLYAFVEFMSDATEEYDFIKILLDNGYVSSEFILTSSAFEKIEEIENSNLKSTQAFVAMWFNPDDSTVYEQGIKPAIEIDPFGSSTGFRAFRVDHEHHADFIMDFMIGNIKRSKFMVADFTSYMVQGHRIADNATLNAQSEHFKIVRGGVYYEAGYAMGMGIPVIATCKKDQTSHIHFDLQQLNTIYWEDVDDLRKKLSERIFGMFAP